MGSRSYIPSKNRLERKAEPAAVVRQNPNLSGKEDGKPKGTGVFTKSIKTSGREIYKRYLIPSLS